MLWSWVIKLKHLGICRKTEQGVELRVHPTLIPKSKMLSRVDGVMNAVEVKGDAVGPTLYCGAGAGAEPTASAVVADLIDIARCIESNQKPLVPYLGFMTDKLNDWQVLPIDKIETAYYLRISALDEPGVLSKVGQILGDVGVSIEAVIQKEPEQGQTKVQVILLTSRSLQYKLDSAVSTIESLSVIEGPVVRIRVEALN